jgi:hypothetical protein
MYNGLINGKKKCAWRYIINHYSSGGKRVNDDEDDDDDDDGDGDSRGVKSIKRSLALNICSFVRQCNTFTS